MTRLIVLFAVSMFVGPIASVAQDPAIPIIEGTSLGIVPRGGAAGGDAVYCNGCDFVGPRNLQGGGPGGQPFDIGAGSTEDPSNLVFNWDVGLKSLFYSRSRPDRRPAGQADLMLSVGPDGTRMSFKGKPLAWFGPAGIVFYRRPTCRCPRGLWTWTRR